MQVGFDVSKLELKVHANKEYPPNEVRHFSCHKSVRSSSSGQFGRQNFPKLVKLIHECHQGKIFFIDAREDTHFELNGKQVSLKRIVPQDDNAGLPGDQVVAKERTVCQFFLNKMVTFIPKEPHGNPMEEMVTEGAIVRDFIEHQKWNGCHTYQRFALSENGPLSDRQADEFLALLDTVYQENGWMHTNSIIGDKAAVLLLVMKDMLENREKDSFEDIIEKYGESGAALIEIPKEQDEFNQQKTARAAFIKQFYQFAQERKPSQSWTDWKRQSVN